jgi:hypothetical protein
VEHFGDVDYVHCVIQGCKVGVGGHNVCFDEVGEESRAVVEHGVSYLPVVGYVYRVEVN